LPKYRLITAMDISSSMSTDRKFRSYKHFQKIIIGLEQEGFEEAYIKHFIQFTTRLIESTNRYANNPKAFFSQGRAGGTYISSGLNEILKAIKETPKDILNIIIVYSDGDNWGEDNPRCIEAIKQISHTNSIFIFTNVSLSKYTSIVEDKIMESYFEYKNPVIMSKTNENIVDESIKELLAQINKAMKQEEYELHG